MSHAEQATNLYRNLAEECDIAMTLVDVLFEEQACLVKLETDKLAVLALKKEGMMLELEKRYTQNVHLAQSLGFQPDLNGLAAWVDDLAATEPRLQGTYSTFRSTLQQAQRLNVANGELVSEQLAGLQERISILTAAAVAEQKPAASDTYGPRGALSNAGSGVGSTPRAVIR